jgi:hypothetical protein
VNPFQKPKRLSPFLLFVKTRRSHYEKQHTGETPLTMRDILYEAGKEWHTLTEAQKQVYRDESTLLAAQN